MIAESLDDFRYVWFVRAVRRADNQRCARRLFPERQLSNLLFANVVAVIAPKDNDGVVPVTALFESIEHMTDAGISERASSEAALDSFFPFAAFTDVLHVLFAHPPANRGDVVEIVCLVGRKFNVFERMHVEELLRGIPGKMWQVDTATEEKGFVVISPEELSGTVGGFPIRIGFNGSIGRSPVDEPGEDRIRFKLWPETVLVTFTLRRRDRAGAS